MKKEDLITAAELHALLAENGEDLQEFEMNKPIGTQHLHSLQKAVVLLSQQVADLQTQLHAHFELQNKQQEQLLRQFKYQIEHKLHEQLIEWDRGTAAADEHGCRSLRIKNPNN